MRTKFLPKILFAAFALVFSASVLQAQVTETEPNNTPAQAKALPLNGYGNGAIIPAGDVDWWKVKTNGDGLLSVTLAPLSGKYTYVEIYDTLGVIKLAGNYSNGTFSISADGLAQGTYYLKVYCYYGTDTSSYKISNTLTKPSQANDVEPNNTKVQASVLPLNGSTTGHVGYYFKNNRDTTDWYKVTTNLDGILRLSLTPADGQYTYVTLYDNNGTTVLNTQYSNSAFSISTDGLAAGTYYMRVYCFYSAGFAPYTLSDSLFTPAQANDAEPNDTKVQANVLPLNGSTTGHVGYFYNNHRDTADWYSVTTNEDGLLRLSLNPADGQYTYVTLYDNNGTTVLNQAYSNSPFSFSTDGLTAGTYYLRVYCFYSAGFAPYTLSDSLFTYNYANDLEPNNKPYLAKTLPANTATPGHVGFYYNNQRDSVDWQKFNYTGSGALSVSLNLEPTKVYGGQYTYMQIYADTASAPIYSSYSTSSFTANLTSLAQGYYYVKVFEFYNSNFEAYTITPTFTQVNVAKINARSYDTLASCSSTNNIVFQASKSSKPYTIELYRYGVAYGTPIVTTKAYTFKNLPTGSYYAIAFGDGATGTAFGKSRSVSVEPVPANLSSTNITNVQAKLNWDAVDCAGYYTVQYRVQGNPTWTTKKTKNTTPSYLVKGLTASTTYEWQVATSDSANGIVATGAYSSISTFTTASAFSGGNNGDEVSLFGKGNTKEDNNSVAVFPNPASNYFTISYSSTKTENVNAMLYNMNGKAVWTSGAMNASALNGQKVAVSQFASGLYYLKIMDDKGAIQSVIKVSIIK